MIQLKKYFVEIAYNGKGFHGWQKQNNALSIQQIIEEKLQILFRQKLEIVGCGRTDTGVHAQQFFFHFETNIVFSKDYFFKLNALIPASIVIKNIYQVPQYIHARFDAIERTYQYFIHQRHNPFCNDFSLYYHYPLNMEALHTSSKVIKENTNFASFCKSNNTHKTFLCHIKEVSWKKKNGDSLVFTITADRFLRNMVRAIVGTLLEIGQGRKNIEYLEKLFQSQDRTQGGVSVQPHGLFLSKVKYGFPLVEL